MDVIVRSEQHSRGCANLKSTLVTLCWDFLRSEPLRDGGHHDGEET